MFSDVVKRFYLFTYLKEKHNNIWMASLTVDLDYFKCDMCGTYFHKDIYCDHRRQCKGKDSQELKKGEVAAIAGAIDETEREREKILGIDHPVKRGTIDKMAATQRAQLRRNVADEEQQRQDEQLKKKLESAGVDDLLAELDGDRFGKK